MTKNNFEKETMSMDSLRKLCQNGLIARYNPVTEEIQARLDYELSVIEEKGFADYFLMVCDIISFAKEHHIITGPGRGSSVGSLVCFALGITRIDPIRNKLIFERFINPLKTTHPEITIDIIEEGLSKISDYAGEKYGETAGLSFARLKELSAIEKAYEKGIALDNISYDDKKVYELISSGETEGIFLLDDGRVLSLINEVKPACIEEITAVITLWRPLADKQASKYVNGKRNPEAVTYRHPLLKPILNETYGCILYQEQVTEIAQKLAGYSAAEAELMRVAILNRKPETAEAERGKFITGCVNNGIDEDTASAIFDDLFDTACLTFNKSHAIAYAYLSYQTAYLKTLVG